jgi:hypothetical protein
MSYGYDKSVSFSQNVGSYRMVMKSDSTTKTTTFFSDLYTGAAPSIAFTGFTSISLGTNTVITPSTNKILASIVEVASTLDVTGGQVRLADGFKIRTGGSTFSNAGRLFQIGNDQTSAHMGLNAGPVTVSNATGNTSFGVNTLSNVGSSAQRNVSFGGYSGRGITSGVGNTLLGWAVADQGNFSKSVVIGDSAMYNQSGSNKLWIENTAGSTPLLSGDFTTNNVGINIASAAPTARLHIGAGSATANTAPLKLTSGTNLTTAEAGAVEYDGTEFYATNSGASRTILARVLKGSATLDFPDTASGSSSSLTITVTGAATTDSGVSVQRDNASISGTMYEWVITGTDTVTVYFHNFSGSNQNPASGTFRATVTK